MPQQTTICEQLLELVVVYSHPNQLQNRMHTSLFQAVVFNLLVFLDKSSPVFVNRNSEGGASDSTGGSSTSIDIFNMSSNSSYRVSVVEVALSLALGSLGVDEVTAGRSSDTRTQYFWLDKAGEGMGMVTIDHIDHVDHSSYREYQCPAQILCLLVNKVRPIIKRPIIVLTKVR